MQIMQNLVLRDGNLSDLVLFPDMVAFVLTAASQETGEKQNLYYVENSNADIEVHSLAQFVGNYLDIDNWYIENFSV